MAENDNIHAGHRGRMLGRFGREGIKVFSEHEMLEVLLYFMFARVNTNAIAHDLISSFGSLKNVLSASVCELKRIDGIGEKSARRLRFIGDLANCFNQAQAAIKDNFASIEDVVGFCADHFKDKFGEFLSLLLLDAKSSPLHMHNIISGVSVLPDHFTIDYREVIRQIVNYNCRKVVIAQKRNFGSAVPSDYDIKVTREIEDILRMIDVGIVDHVIICNEKAASMRSSGLLNGIWAV